MDLLKEYMKEQEENTRRLQRVFGNDGFGTVEERANLPVLVSSGGEVGDGLWLPEELPF